MADARQLLKVSSIVKADRQRRFVVVSAPGKRFKDDKKITDLLYICHELVQNGLTPDQPFSIIKERYVGIAQDLGLTEPVAEWCDEVYQQLADGADRDLVASRGEYLSARLTAAFLGATFIDAEGSILMTQDGRLRPDTYEHLGRKLKGKGRFVLPGFYGTTPEGRIKTFPRGGSDITGAIVARSVNASLYENWTDVDGFLMADPKVIPSAQVIPEVTYRELRELAYRGAKVLHDEAIFPVRDEGIPINIRNTENPSHPGSLILPERDFHAAPIVGIAGRKDFETIQIEKALMNREVGFGRKVLEIFETRGISFEHAPTGIDTICVVVQQASIAGKTDSVVEEIKRVLEPDSVEVVRAMALIATVGLGMSHKIGIAAELFRALAKAKVNIRMIDQPPDEITIIVGVDIDDYERATKAIYREFVS